MTCNSFVQHMNDEVLAGLFEPHLSSIQLDISSATIADSQIVNRNVFDTLLAETETINIHGSR